MTSQNILNTIGNTSLVKINKLNKNNNVNIFAKIEGVNPGGSIKDRVALKMIDQAIIDGKFNKDKIIIEATSGNTGIALAMIAQLLGLDIELVLPENSTKERVQTMRAYGAKVTLTPADVGILGSRDYADKKVNEEGYTMLNKLGNEENWKKH